MTAKKMHILKAARYPVQDDHEQDTLLFKEGVNVIVGELNAGKTKWLQMIDFVLGDDGKPEEAFDKELAEKYDRVTLTAVIGAEEFTIERRWKESGAKSKIFVNDEGMTSKHFSEFILGRLQIPIIHVPSGNPYADRTWPVLSWREMFRHMYKQERFWSDFAQKQADVVRSACILHFLNAATSLYPKEYGVLVTKKKEKDRLEAQKDVFVRVLQDVAIEVVGQPEMTVAVTPESISESRQRLNARLAEIDVAKAAVLENYDRQSSTETPVFNTAKNNLESLHQELGKIESERNDVVRRHSELTEYAKTLEAELTRFERVKAGASVFADLKVTHCPACDQELKAQNQDPDHCPVCGRTHMGAHDDISAGSRRIEFEEQQVSEELDELRRLIRELEQELRSFDVQISEIAQRIQEEKRSINSARALSVRAIPPELALFDQEAGRIMSQLQQLNRIERTLGTREEINAKILAREEEIESLDAEIKRLTPTINYERLSDLLSDKMNTYLNLVNADNFSRWKTGRVSIKLRKDAFDLFLDGQPWTIRAGGTANYIIQIAYHYTLLSLSNNEQSNYPGFLIIDFPPHFSKAGDLGDSENYLLKPFVDLCKNEDMGGAQVIIAGRAFDKLEGANILHL
jgi:peptidoglycan hydrolase CwlO-like protein